MFTKLMLALMLAAFLGSLSGFWALIDRGYQLGMETRAFWPPERLMPFSPISVASPAGSISRSLSS